jgi:hypothetical protein
MKQKLESYMADELNSAEDSSNTNPTKNQGWTQVPRKGKQFMLH